MSNIPKRQMRQIEVLGSVVVHSEEEKSLKERQEGFEIGNEK